ncbi:MAG: hypothetical protein AB1601_08240 [Planctomycetota bacterium]
MSRAVVLAALALLGALVSGCATEFGEQARYGITFYCPGAGVDLGDAGVREGLQQAGYRGQVARMTWSLSMNPAVDQTVRIIARQGGERLAQYIQQYIDKYPDGEVNIVGLSAGTGVAIWALEALKPGYKVNNVILIASSLSHDYDVSKAVRRVNGKIYNYYSPTDAVLAGPMKVFGTIDGAFLKDGAGAVGLRVPRGAGDRVVNIRWRPEFEKWGYYGGHMDGTNPTFVRYEIARHIIGSGGGEGRRIAFATPWGQVLQAAHRE